MNQLAHDSDCVYIDVAKSAITRGQCEIGTSAITTGGEGTGALLGFVSVFLSKMAV